METGPGQGNPEKEEADMRARLEETTSKLGERFEGEQQRRFEEDANERARNEQADAERVARARETLDRMDKKVNPPDQALSK